HMIELNLDFIDFQDDVKRLNDIVHKLESNGWGKFIDCSGILFYKNIIKDSAIEELNHLGINELEPVEWTETIEI
ncbi:MAG: hypothetical protein J7K26_04445, partial [Candidatus Aenigmarchaeota archaeon]|nr:hypothetical protein [Candidatus Aenigmarchaeota archaeon]